MNSYPLIPIPMFFYTRLNNLWLVPNLIKPITSLSSLLHRWFWELSPFCCRTEPNQLRVSTYWSANDSDLFIFVLLLHFIAPSIFWNYLNCYNQKSCKMPVEVFLFKKKLFSPERESIWCCSFIDRFAKSKRRYIEAHAEYAKEEAIVSMLRTQLASQQSIIDQDSHSLRYVGSL